MLGWVSWNKKGRTSLGTFTIELAWNKQKKTRSFMHAT